MSEVETKAPNATDRSAALQGSRRRRVTRGERVAMVAARVFAGKKEQDDALPSCCLRVLPTPQHRRR